MKVNSGMMKILEIFTEIDYPNDWALIHNNLSDLYKDKDEIDRLFTLVDRASRNAVRSEKD